jgi:hypothetical protein
MSGTNFGPKTNPVTYFAIEVLSLLVSKEEQIDLYARILIEAMHAKN